MKFIDNFLNSITMYRLVLYSLIFLVVIAAVFDSIGWLPHDPLRFLYTVILLVGVCWGTNKIFAKAFKAPSNGESSLITALILSLIVSPIKSGEEFIFICWVGVLAMASKYILALHNKHLFNPTAIALAITAYTMNQSASWWIGNAHMFPYVLICGFLIVKKLRRFQLVGSFLLTALAVISGMNLLQGEDIRATLEKAFLYAPLFFLGTVMLTEPQTMPPTRKYQLVYGSLVGILYAPQVHIGTFYATPEMALLIGNLFSYLVSPKEKLLLKLQEKVATSPETYDFVFSASKKLSFIPGQYLEWTLSHPHSDSRGIRRYFTIASSPTEETLRIGVKISKDSSTFKKRLVSMKPNDEVVVSQLSGDFVLPKNDNHKYVFIAGGIGITPFRSIIKYGLDTRAKRDIILFFSNRHESEIVYKELFEKAQEVGLRTVYVLTDEESIPHNWQGRKGRINGQMIAEEVPDYKERMFYLSGPNAMVQSYKQLLSSLGVSKKQIVTDYFPGY
jgi:ferredoxin-NADP reductase/Na+-translocating ferredoxin:NAD+ oxidoreductase RnfD subunit